MKAIIAIVILMVINGGAWCGEAAGFDPARHWDIVDLERGMKGYGLTVFAGTKPERFDVELVSVIRNFSPGRSVALVRVVNNEIFALAKGVQGASGSPVYFEGKLAGAMSFGWAFSEEPLYGVTPIKEMLEVRQSRRVGSLTGERMSRLPRSWYEGLMRKELLNASQRRELTKRCGWGHWNGKSEGGLEPLGLSFCVGGMSSAAEAMVERLLGGIELQSSGTMGDSHDDAVSLVPGGTVTVPLLRGDFNGAILGTVTEVLGDEVYAFGHGWMGEGAVDWPMAGGRVHTFVSRKDISFKLGDATGIVGRLAVDESTAVYGELGDAPAMVPLSIRVKWDDTGFDTTYDIDILRDKMLSPTLTVTALANCVFNRGGLPREHTLRYRFGVEFDGMESLDYSNVSAADGGQGMLFDFYMMLGMVLLNPWGEVEMTGLKAEVVIEHEDRLAQLDEVTVPVRKVKPGESVLCRLKLLPYQQEAFYREVSFTVPEDLPAGEYMVEVLDGGGYLDFLQQTNPGNYIAKDVASLHRIFSERQHISAERVYLALRRPDEAGLHTGEAALPKLPGSRMQLLQGSETRLTVPMMSAVTEDFGLDYVMSGQFAVPITVEE